MYIFCNKTLIADYLNWAIKHNYKYDILVLIKQNPIPAYNLHYLNDLEYIIIIREGGTYFSKEKDIDLYRKWYMTVCKKHIHPAQKPLELIQKFIKVGSKEGDTVLDPFMGSGTTGIACTQLRRSFIGIETNNHYFNIAKDLINHTQLSLF